MIYLIAGAPRCGKTTIAQKLSKKLQISWISVDTIESIIANNTPEIDMVKLFPKSVVRKQTKQSNDIMYTKYSAKEIKALYVKQAESVWSAVDMMVNCEINEGNNFIIEGHQIHPKLIAVLKNKHGKHNICSLVITRFDINGIVEGCLKHKAKNDWFIKKTKDNKTYYKIAEMIKEYSNFFDKEAKKYKVSIVNVDTSFVDKINHSVKLLQGRLK